MSVRYHISPKTGNPNICRAKNEGGCPFGNDSEHFDTKQDARAAYEHKMEQLAKEEAEKEKANKEKARQERMAAAERNWPSPSEEAVEAYRKNNFAVDPKHKILEKINEPMLNKNTATISILSGKTNAVYGNSYNALDQPMSYRTQEDRPAKIEFTDYGTILKEMQRRNI